MCAGDAYLLCRTRKMTPKQFKEARHELMFTQQELANRIGKKVRIIKSYESGHAKIPQLVEMYLLERLQEKSRK